MKKTLFFAAAAICAAALAVSCENMEVVSDVQHDYRTVTLQLPTPDTKVAISEENGKIKWVAGDEIIVHGKLVAEMQTITLADADISADGLTATITFDASKMTPHGDHDYYAQYPASATHPSSSTNAYHYCEFNDTNKPLMGAYLDSQTNTFIFRNLCGIISFKINGDYDEYQFVGNNEEVVGYKQYGIKRTATDTYVREPGEALYAISGSLVADGNTPNLICIAPTYIKDVSSSTTTFSGGFSIRLKKNGEIVKVVKSSKEFTLHRNEYVVLGDISNRIEDYVPETHQNKITGATNLGATETANCYVISSAGSYKIPAVKGNSSTSVGTVAGAKILWETYHTLDDVAAKSVIAAVDYEADAVFFKTPDTLQPGNALIAAVDENENIIWSWHIWIPASDIQDIGDSKVYPKYIQDRNLGAIVPTEVPASGTVDLRSVGLYYQWGRKDPFVGYKFGKVEVEPKVSGDAARSMTKLTAKITIEESIAQPTSFVAFKGNWLNEEDNDLWGKGGDKTIYDPCPAGYRVPDYTGPVFAKLTEDANFSADVNGHWWQLGSAVFTFTGCYDYDGGIAHPYDRTWLWSNEAHSTAEYSQSQYLYLNGEAWASEPGWGKRKACGVPVRCMKIEGEVPADPEPEQPEEPSHTDVAVTLDGDVSEWANVESISGGGAPMTWKYTSDANNLYFYAKITASKIKCNDDSTSESYLLYRWRRYFYIGFDTDNNAATGQSEDLPGGLTMTGCEANALLFPFSGSAPAPDAYPEGVLGINGLDEDGWIKLADGTTTDSKITAYGYLDGDYFYLEMGVPRAGIGSPSSGTVNVQFSFSWDLSNVTPIIIQ